MSDRVLLTGMVFYGHHGVRPQEKDLGQPFVVDLVLEADLKAPGASDRLEDTVDYSNVYRLVRDIITGPSHNLLESLAEDVAQDILRTFPLAVNAVRVRVTKPHVAIEGALLEGAGVEIYRQRGE
ncbi:MAG: dihydroneopterin aldolase [Chloroflexi bacterium]|nr:dihydroneopterin aldolase [Chloroflexota bacterium]